MEPLFWLAVPLVLTVLGMVVLAGKKRAARRHLGSGDRNRRLARMARALQTSPDLSSPRERR